MNVRPATIAPTKIATNDKGSPIALGANNQITPDTPRNIMAISGHRGKLESSLNAGPSHRERAVSCMPSLYRHAIGPDVGLLRDRSVVLVLSRRSRQPIATQVNRDVDAVDKIGNEPSKSVHQTFDVLI